MGQFDFVNNLYHTAGLKAGRQLLPGSVGMVDRILTIVRSRWAKFVFLRHYPHKNVHGRDDQNGDLASVMERGIVASSLRV